MATLEIFVMKSYFQLIYFLFLSELSRGIFRSGAADFFMQLNEGVAVSAGGHLFERLRFR